MSARPDFGASDPQSRSGYIPHGVREELRLLSTLQPNRDEYLMPVLRLRPLGDVSNYLCSTMPSSYDAVLKGSKTPGQLFDEVEEQVQDLDLHTVEQLLSTPTSTAARVALLDLAFIERFLSVAHGGATVEYRARRAHAAFYRLAVRLARSQHRPVHLQWTDIAGGHPVWDPRTFLSPGRGRDQEVMLYRVQSAIDRAFQGIVVEWPETYISEKACQSIADDLDAVVDAMIHLSLVRDKGEFHKLNVFLTPNGETHGHATGSFSIWTILAGYMLTGHLLERAVYPENRLVFDPDSRPWIDAVIAGEIVPLPTLCGKDVSSPLSELGRYVVRQYGRFHEVHRGAIRKHAKEALQEAAPSDSTLTNSESIDKAIRITKGDPVEDHQDDVA